jgi:hypothetical protein
MMNPTSGMSATDEQPFQGNGCWTCLTQGSSCLATLGCGIDAFGIGLGNRNRRARGIGGRSKYRDNLILSEPKGRSGRGVCGRSDYFGDPKQIAASKVRMSKCRVSGDVSSVGGIVLPVRNCQCRVCEPSPWSFIATDQCWQGSVRTVRQIPNLQNR